MNSTLLIDVPFDSDEAWGSFTLYHGLMHQTTEERLLATNAVPDYFPAYDFPRDKNSEYLLDHWQNHQSNAQLLGLPIPQDISTVDFTQEGQFYDWLAIHAQIHALENAALGIM